MNENNSPAIIPPNNVETTVDIVKGSENTIFKTNIEKVHISANPKPAIKFFFFTSLFWFYIGANGLCIVHSRRPDLGCYCTFKLSPLLLGAMNSHLHFRLGYWLHSISGIDLYNSSSIPNCNFITKLCSKPNERQFLVCDYLKVIGLSH